MWAQANFEEVTKGGSGKTDQATAADAEELGIHAETLTEAASRVATQVVAGVRDGAVGMVSNIRAEVAKCAESLSSSVKISRGLNACEAGRTATCISVTKLGLLQYVATEHWRKSQTQA